MRTSSALASEHVAVAGTCSILASIMSLHLIVKHLNNYTKPDEQKHVVRIIAMVPVYSIESFASLLIPEMSVLFATLREIYEAYVIYQFMALCIGFLGGERLLVSYMEDLPTMKHPWPFNKCCSSYQPNSQFLRLCKRYILQYVLVRPATAITALILDLNGMYDDGEFSWSSGYGYLTVINNISVSYSLYYLAIFYVTTKDALQPINPVAKFTAVKAVIFFSYWQGLSLAIAVRLGWIDGVTGFEPEKVATALQDYLICIEMFLASIAHLYAFSAEAYLPHRMQRRRMVHRPIHAVSDALNFARDLWHDSIHTFSNSNHPTRELDQMREQSVPFRTSFDDGEQSSYHGYDSEGNADGPGDEATMTSNGLFLPGPRTTAPTSGYPSASPRLNEDAAHAAGLLRNIQATGPVSAPASQTQPF